MAVYRVRYLAGRVASSYPSSVRIALATCSGLPDWEVDDEPLRKALRGLGAKVIEPAWDDSEFNWQTVDACLIRTTWDYVPRHREFVAWAERVSRRTLLFNSPDVVRWNVHKGYLKELETRGVPIVPTCWLEAGAAVDLEAVLRSQGWRRAFLKPAVGATASDTLRFEMTPSGLREAESHLNRMLPVQTMLLQPYLWPVESRGELSAIWIDGRVTHAVRKVPRTGDYRVQDDYGATDRSYALNGAELERVRKVFDALDTEILYGRADFLWDDRGSLRLSELELVEPSLFFRHSPTAAEALAGALLARIQSERENGSSGS